MNDNRFQPGEEIFDETQGHTLKSHLVDEDDEATEGHRFHGTAVPEDEETEGHVFRHALPEDEDEETEGHRYSGY